MVYKTSKYTIMDDFYFDILYLLAEELEKKEIPYAVVGGAAFQAKIASILTENGKKDLKGLERIIFRETGDVDLTTNSDYSSMVTFFNEIASLYKNFHIENKVDKSMGIKKGDNLLFVNYQTEPSDLKGLTNQYQEIIKTAETVTLKKGKKQLFLQIPKLEYLIVSKLIRLEEKDRVDIFNLLHACEGKGIRVNYEEVKSILKAVNKEDKFDYIKEIFYDVHSNSK